MLILVAITVAVLVKSLVVQPFYIPSGSMEKTLHGCPGCAGDKILVNKPIYRFRSPEPGDIVVFHDPTGWADTEGVPVTPQTNAITGAVRRFGQLIGIVPPDETDLVKRVIATGGEGVRCCDAQGRVQISKNGLAGPWVSLHETYVYNDGPDEKKVFDAVLVPKGRLWVMGDHRNFSADSRYHCGEGKTCNPRTSTVPVSNVIGKAFVIAWPPKRWRTLGTPATFSTAGALGSAIPVEAGLVVVAPFALLRRGRRGRRRRRP